MTPAGTYVEANGLRVYYEVCGEGEPLLLIHGGTATCRSWTSHLPAFTEHLRVVLEACATGTSRMRMKMVYEEATKDPYRWRARVGSPPDVHRSPTREPISLSVLPALLP